MSVLPVFMLNLPYQTAHQRNPRRQIIQFYKFPRIVGEAAACSQAVEGGDAQSSSGIGIGCAAAAHVLNLEAQRAACLSHKLDKPLVCLVAFKGLAEHTAVEGDSRSLQLILSSYLSHRRL